ncbi:MAG: hypothetical protein QXW94_06065 [Desulfurococcaceae archaeon]
MAKMLSKYKLELEKAGLKQLDVYRYPGHEELRVRTADGSVVTIKLPSHREAMKLEEFREHVTNALTKAKESKKKKQ